MKTILKYFPELNSKQADQFSKIGAIYKEWNQKINVISRKDIDHFYLKHVLHSLAIAKFMNFNAGASVLDVGTGGGFPGIPLAIMFPKTTFHLIDSIAKKIKVVNEVVDLLDLNNVTTEQIRVESLKLTYDFIVSRAVTAFPDFVNFTKNKISKRNNHSISNGIIYLKGGNFENEIKAYNKRIEITEISDYFEEEFFETKKIIHLPF